MTAPTEDLIAWMAREKRSMIMGSEICLIPASLVDGIVQALRAMQADVMRLRHADARLHAITRTAKCPSCELTKAQCADTIAEIEIGRSALQAEVERLRGELRRIAEGNLGPMSWQADYDKIRDTARSALTGSAQG